MALVLCLQRIDSIGYDNILLDARAMAFIGNPPRVGYEACEAVLAVETEVSLGELLRALDPEPARLSEGV